MEYNLDDILLKDVDGLTDAEKGFLREHASELENTEKESYKDILEEKKEEKVDNTGGFNFKTQEELDKYLEEKIAAKIPAPKEDKKEDDIPDFVSKDWKPADWNDAFKTLLKHPKFMEYLTKNENLKGTVKETITETEQAKENSRKEINQKIDDEIAAIRGKDKDIPAVGTPEALEWEKKIAQTFVDFPSLRSVDEAYRIVKLSELKKEIKEDEKEDLARKVGGGKATGEVNKERKYSEIARRDMDAAYDAALAKLTE